MKICEEGMQAKNEGRGNIDFPLPTSSGTTWNGSILFVIPHDFETCY